MVYLFYNPKSNAGKTEKEIHILEKKLNKRGYSTIKINLIETVDVNEIIAGILPDDLLFIAGGDGTINWVLNNHILDGLNNKIYVYRSGRGNDYSRNFKKKVFLLENGLANFPQIKYNETAQNFINGVGMGIDAVTCNIQHDNFLAGRKVSYFSVACKAFQTFKPYSLDVIVDGKSLHFDNVWFFVIQNGKYIGGGMKISPKSIVNDGKLELVVIHSMKLNKLLRVFPSIFIGKHTIFKKNVTILEGKEFKCVPYGTEILQIDGEIRKNIKTIEVKC